MKGLIDIPTKNELSKVYDSLQGVVKNSIREEDLALWSQWSRLDPRLAEILTAFLFRHWQEFSPARLNTELQRQPWPSAFGVLIEQITAFFEFNKKSDKKLFYFWSKCVMSEIKKAPWEQFFVGQRFFGSKAMANDARLSIEPFLKWGYLGREILINKAGAKIQGYTLVPFENRRAILKDLALSNRKIRIQDYLQALGGCLSSRQAQLDLKSCPFFRPRGRTKSRTYHSAIFRDSRDGG